MNHYADIDEGREVFADMKERADAEAHFRSHPGDARITLDGVTVTPCSITTIILTGSLRLNHRTAKLHPFDFEEGYLEATGTRSSEHGPQYCSAVVRWSDYGAIISGSIK